MAIITSVLTGGDNLHETTSEEVNAVATDFVSEGVVGAITNTADVAPMTGAYAVNAQGTPDMTVAVTAGVAYVTGTPTGQSSQTLRVKLTANENVTISANSSGSTKYDWIYIDVDADAAADPAVGADDVSDLVTSRSSSSSTDDGTPPTYGTLIAVVTVSNGASSITNGNISDRRVRTGAKPAEGDVGTDQLAAAGVTSEKLGATVACRAYLAVTHNIGQTATKIVFDTENFDVGSDFDLANARFVAPITGYYQVNASVNVTNLNAADNQIQTFIYVNGSVYSQSKGYGAAAGTDPAGTVSDLVPVTAGQYIEIYALHDSSTANEAVTVGSSVTFVSIYLVGAA